jgi:hydrogenase nickel incorporation protein HypA/HybF
MHEFSLAQSVQETVTSIALQQKAKIIKKVVLKFGSFALIQEDQFRFCFDIIKKESEILKDTDLEIKWVPGELRCLDCEFEGFIDNIQQEHGDFAPIFKCPKCESYSTEILSGTDSTIDSIIVA